MRNVLRNVISQIVFFRNAFVAIAFAIVRLSARIRAKTGKSLLGVVWTATVIAGLLFAPFGLRSVSRRNIFRCVMPIIVNLVAAIFAKIQKIGPLL